MVKLVSAIKSSKSNRTIHDRTASVSEPLLQQSMLCVGVSEADFVCILEVHLHCLDNRHNYV